MNNNLTTNIASQIHRMNKKSVTKSLYNSKLLSASIDKNEHKNEYKIDP